MASFRLEFEHQGQTRSASFTKDSVSIGRDRSSDFVLDHPTVSRQHALIISEAPGDYQLVVLSRGGLTAIDGQQVESSEVRLYDGTDLTFGQYTVHFRSEEAPRKPSSRQQTGGGGAGRQAGGQQTSRSGSAAGAAPAGASFQSGTQGGAEASPSGDSGGFGAESSFGGGGPPGSSQDDLSGAESQSSDDDEADDPANIASWDEIAAEDEDSSEQPEETSRSVRDLKAARDEEDEETNPVIVGVAAVLAIGFLAFGFLSGGSDEAAEIDRDEVSIFEQEPVELEPDCYDPSSCKQEAYSHYERGIDLIEQRAIETGNLFRGYHRLLQARAYLEEGGVDEIPEDMEKWHEKHDMARERLDNTFRDFRVEYHRAQQADRRDEMEEIIEDIETHFPERTARENQWAREREREMLR